MLWATRRISRSRCWGIQKGRTAVNNATLLVIDDEPQVRRVLQATLFSNGFDVIEAKNGKEGIEMAVRERPDLILLDVNMPDMSGFEVCSKIRASFEGPIIMLTVRNSEHDKIAALDSGAGDYVVKPFAMGELLARIRAALRRFSSEEPLPKMETPELNVDLERRIVIVRGRRVHLSPIARSYEIASAPGEKLAVNLPAVAGLPVDQHLGNLEGKEMRFRTSAGAIFSAVTVDVTCGAVNAEHDSLNPFASLAPMTGMWLNCIFGGKGVGMINPPLFLVIW